MRLDYILTLSTIVVGALVRGVQCGGPKHRPRGPDRMDRNAIEYIEANTHSSTILSCEAMGVCPRDPDGSECINGYTDVRIEDDVEISETLNELKKLSAMFEDFSTRLDQRDTATRMNSAEKRSVDNLDEEPTTDPRLIDILDLLVKAQESSSSSSSNWSTILTVVITIVNFLLGLLNFFEKKIVKSSWLKGLAKFIGFKDTESEVTTLKGNFTTLEKRVDKLETSVGGDIVPKLATDLGELTTKVNNLQTSVGGDIVPNLATAISGLRTELGELNSKVNNLQTNVGGNNVQELVKNLDTLRKDFKESDSKVSALETKFRAGLKTVQAIRSRVRAVKLAIESTTESVEKEKETLQSLQVRFETHERTSKDLAQGLAQGF